MKKKIETLLLAVTLVMTCVVCYAREDYAGGLPEEEGFIIEESDLETEGQPEEEGQEEGQEKKAAEEEMTAEEAAQPVEEEEETAQEETQTEADAGEEPAAEEFTEKKEEEDTQEETVPVMETAKTGNDVTDAVNVIDITDGDLSNFISVAWKDLNNGILYNGKNDSADAEIIKGLSGGKHMIVINLTDQYVAEGGSKVFLSSGEYTYQLAWPGGENISVKMSVCEGDILIWEDVRGKWSVSSDGEFNLQIEIPDDLHDYNEEISFEIQIFESGSAGESPRSASIEKTAEYDPYTQKISWIITAAIPAWNGSGEYNKWHLGDIVSVDTARLTSYIVTDFSGISVKMALTSEYEAEGEETGWTVIPDLADAGEEDDICFYLELMDNISKDACYIWFLNRCGEECIESGCMEGTDGKCSNPAEGYDDWCTCWHSAEDVTFRIEFSTGVGELIDILQTANRDEKAEKIRNWAGIFENDDIRNLVAEANADVTVHPLIRKEILKEICHENNYIGEYKITVNPDHEDFSATDCIIISDTMQNMSYELGSMEIIWTDESGNTGIMEPKESEAGSASAQRRGNENKYFSVTADPVEDDGTGDSVNQNIRISIWFPGDETYTITYKALALDVSMGSLKNYGNEAVIGEVSASVSGKSYSVDENYEAGRFKSTVKKVDADDNEKSLAGTEFNVYQLNIGSDDTLITSLTTGDDGTAIFQESRKNGIYINENMLYYFQEVSAPEGYNINDEKFYFYFSPEDDMQLPEGIMAQSGQKDGGVYTLTATVSDESMPAPKISKFLSDRDDEDDEENFGTENNCMLEYRIIAENIGGASNLVIHDWLDEQLSYGTLNVRSVTLYKNSEDEGTELEKDITYFITDGTCSAYCGLEGCSFEIHIDDDILKELSSDACIEIVYDISLSESFDRFDDSLIDEIINCTGQSYGVSEYSDPDTAKTASFGFTIYKYAQNDIPLAGAEFILSEYGPSGETYPDDRRYAQFDVRESTFLFTGWTENIDEAAVIITGEDGKAAVEGLGGGIYILEETKAPDGYNIMTAPVKITVKDGGNSVPVIIVNGETADEGIVNIENEKKPESPGETETESEPEPEPATEDESGPEPEPVTEDESESESESTTEPGPESESEPATEPGPDSEAVKTGDTARIFTFAFLMIAAFLLIMTEIICKIKKAHR